LGVNASVLLRYNHAAAMAANLRKLLGQVVRKTAFDIEAGCKARSRVDTGAMRAGWYTSTFDANGFEAAAAAAQSAGGKDVKLVTPSAYPADDLEAIVGNAVEYAIYNEMGTVHMSAQPMLGPSVDAVLEGFFQGIERAVENSARS